MISTRKKIRQLAKCFEDDNKKYPEAEKKLKALLKNISDTALQKALKRYTTGTRTTPDEILMDVARLVAGHSDAIETKANQKKRLIDSETMMSINEKCLELRRFLRTPQTRDWLLWFFALKGDADAIVQMGAMVKGLKKLEEVTADVLKGLQEEEKIFSAQYRVPKNSWRSADHFLTLTVARLLKKKTGKKPPVSLISHLVGATWAYNDDARPTSSFYEHILKKYPQLA